MCVLTPRTVGCNWIEWRAVVQGSSLFPAAARSYGQPPAVGKASIMRCAGWLIPLCSDHVRV